MKSYDFSLHHMFLCVRITISGGINTPVNCHLTVPPVESYLLHLQHCRKEKYFFQKLILKLLTSIYPKSHDIVRCFQDYLIIAEGEPVSCLQYYVLYRERIRG